MNKHWHFMVGFSVKPKLLQIQNFDQKFREVLYGKGIICLFSGDFTDYNNTFSNHLSLVEEDDRAVRCFWLSVAQDWTMGVKKCFFLLFCSGKKPTKQSW